MDTETFEKVQSFLEKYADVLLEWLKLVKKYKDSHCWKPNKMNDPYAVALYENSLKQTEVLRKFVSKTHKDILLTYLKYHPDARITYPVFFTYKEPSTDLALHPVPSDMVLLGDEDYRNYLAASFKK